MSEKYTPGALGARLQAKKDQPPTAHPAPKPVVDPAKAEAGIQYQKGSLGERLARKEPAPLEEVEAKKTKKAK